MEIQQSRLFERQLKKLHDNQRRDVEGAMHEVIENPGGGIHKTGDLAGMRVHKFHMVRQLTLLAYEYDEKADILRFAAVGSHENFYRDLKKHKQ